MMREHSIALSLSLLFHAVVVSLFLFINIEQNIKPKIVVLDFALEKEHFVSGKENGTSVIGKRISENVYRKMDERNVDVQQKRQIVEKEHTVIKQEENSQKKPSSESTMVKHGGPDRVAADPTGQLAVHGGSEEIKTVSGHDMGKGVPAGGDTQRSSFASGGLRVIDYSKGDSSAKYFPFINETLRRHFNNSYPDRARRMGWEGEAILNFVIQQDGSVTDIEIVGTSGRTIFGEHTRQILQKIAFEGKLPYSLQIKNWRASYKLP